MVDDELQDVMKEEGTRGRRPVDATARRRRSRLLKDFRQLLAACATEKDFRKTIEDLGLKPGTSQYADALQAYRDYRGAV